MAESKWGLNGPKFGHLRRGRSRSGGDTAEKVSSSSTDMGKVFPLARAAEPRISLKTLEIEFRHEACFLCVSPGKGSQWKGYTMALAAPARAQHAQRYPQLLFSLLTLVSLAVTLTLSSPAWAAPRVFLDYGGGGPTQTVSVGGIITATVLASDIPAGSDGKGLFNVGFVIDYDPVLLSAATPVLGPLWSGSIFATTKNLPGEVGFTSNRFGEASGPIGDDILLGTVEFTGLAPGTTVLSVSHFTGPGDNVLFDATVLDSSPSFFFGGTVEVLIPEPGTAALLSLGLLGLAIGGRPRCPAS